MRVLGIETSTRRLSVALLDNGGSVAEFTGDGMLRHAQDLIPAIDSLLKRTKISLADLDGFALSIGPGSFTGLRIGVSTVKGLNLATGKPIAAVPTMDILASNIKKKDAEVCVVIDAKKNKLYACLYKTRGGRPEKKSPYLLVTPEELLKKINSRTIFVGDGARVYKKEISKKLPDAEFADESLWIPKADITAALGAEMLQAGIAVSGDELLPMYLYSNKCSIKGIDR